LVPPFSFITIFVIAVLNYFVFTTYTFIINKLQSNSSSLDLVMPTGAEEKS
jgi:hypothetical protein